jgi:hypothetical protein
MPTRQAALKVGQTATATNITAARLASVAKREQ